MIEKELISIMGVESCHFSGNELQGYKLRFNSFADKIKGAVRPGSVKEVQSVIGIANKYAVPLYPVYPGNNGRYEAQQMVRSGCILVDLIKMDRITEVNLKHGYAMLEPGVTQQKLFNCLYSNRLPYFFTVNGLDSESSLIGNALELNGGYFSSGGARLSGMEIVLGNGRILRTGFGHYSDARTILLNQYGNGPALDNLFLQSNFGIVTKAGIELIPRFDIHGAMICRLWESVKLSGFINEMAQLQNDCLIRTTSRVFHRNRTVATLLPLIQDYYAGRNGASAESATRMAMKFVDREFKSEWNAIGGFMCSLDQLPEIQRQCSDRMRKYGNVIILTGKRFSLMKKTFNILDFLPYFDRKHALMHALEPVFQYCRGLPADLSIKTYAWNQELMAKHAGFPGEKHDGFINLLYVLPVKGHYIQYAVETAHTVFKKHGFTAYLSFNVLNIKTIECEIQLGLHQHERNAVLKAHQCIRELNRRFAEAGLIQHHACIYSNDKVMGSNDAFWDQVVELKKLFDPNMIIAPGSQSWVDNRSEKSRQVPGEVWQYTNIA